MVKVTKEEWAEKWNRRTKAAVQDMADGVAKVTEAPGKKAAAKKEKMRANINRALDDGTWEESVAAVPLEEWQNAMQTKGVQRVSQGVDAATQKLEDVAGDLIDHIETGQREVEKMPDLSLEDGINRSATMIRHMSKFKKRRR